MSDAETDDEVTPQLSDQSDDENAAFEAPLPTRERQSIPEHTNGGGTEATSPPPAPSPPARHTPAQDEAVNGHGSAQDDKMNGISHADDDDDETDDEL